MRIFLVWFLKPSFERVNHETPVCKWALLFRVNQLWKIDNKKWGKRKIEWPISFHELSHFFSFLFFFFFLSFEKKPPHPWIDLLWNVVGIDNCNPPLFGLGSTECHHVLFLWSIMFRVKNDEAPSGQRILVLAPHSEICRFKKFIRKFDTFCDLRQSHDYFFSTPGFLRSLFATHKSKKKRQSFFFKRKVFHDAHNITS